MSDTNDAPRAYRFYWVETSTFGGHGRTGDDHLRLEEAEAEYNRRCTEAEVQHAWLYTAIAGDKESRKPLAHHERLD